MPSGNLLSKKKKPTLPPFSLKKKILGPQNHKLLKGKLFV